MMFVTVVFGVLDLRTGEFVYVNAGHNPPLLARGEDEFSHLASEGKADKPLGLVEGLRFRQNSLTLAPGDMLFFYTDGVVETANEAEELYGKVLTEHSGTPEAEEAAQLLAGE